MAEGVYVLCALSSLACASLLHRSYLETGIPLLFWSALCFAGLTLNNTFLLADLIFEPEIDFSIARNLSGLVGCCFLLYGLLWTKLPKPPTIYSHDRMGEEE